MINGLYNLDIYFVPPDMDKAQTSVFDIKVLHIWVILESERVGSWSFFGIELKYNVQSNTALHV